MQEITFSNRKRMFLTGDELQFKNGTSNKVIILSITGQILFYLFLARNDQFVIANIVTIAFIIFLLQQAGFKTSTAFNLKTFHVKFKKYFLGILWKSDSIQLAEDYPLKVKAQSITDSGSVYQIYFPDKHKERVIFETSNNKDMDRTLSFLTEHNVKFEDERPYWK